MNPKNYHTLSADWNDHGDIARYSFCPTLTGEFCVLKQQDAETWRCLGERPFPWHLRISRSVGALRPHWVHCMLRYDDDSSRSGEWIQRWPLMQMILPYDYPGVLNTICAVLNGWAARQRNEEVNYG